MAQAGQASQVVCLPCLLVAHALKLFTRYVFTFHSRNHSLLLLPPASPLLVSLFSVHLPCSLPCLSLACPLFPFPLSALIPPPSLSPLSLPPPPCLGFSPSLLSLALALTSSCKRPIILREHSQNGTRALPARELNKHQKKQTNTYTHERTHTRTHKCTHTRARARHTPALSPPMKKKKKKRCTLLRDHYNIPRRPPSFPPEMIFFLSKASQQLTKITKITK